MPSSSPELLAGYWPAEQSRRILDKTLSYRLASDLSDLTRAERTVLAELVAVGRTLDDLHNLQLHHQALSARRELHKLHERLGRPERTRDLIELDDLFQGPIATTLENELVPFLPVDPWTEGKNVYPWGISRDEIEAWLEAHPRDRDSLLDLHTAVRRSTPAALKRDLTTLDDQPILDKLHPGLRADLERRATQASRSGLYAVPFSVAWPGPTLDAVAHLRTAADAIVAENRDLAAFLRLRAQDLLTDDNEAGDAAWVRGDLGRIDAVIGSYEVYDDDLYGAKGFVGLSLFLRDESATSALRRALDDLPAIEAALPYESWRRVQTDLPAGSYDILAAFGAGKQTGAEILPNDPNLLRKYGRKILVRRNLYTHPEAFSRMRARWESVVDRDQHAEVSAEGRYQQVVWHEIGHYLGPQLARDGRSIEQSLEDDASPIEELKAELASQFAAHQLRELGHLSDADVRGLAAGAILASLRPVKPLRSQPYPTLWLMEFNWFLDRGVVVYEDGSLLVNWERHRAAVTDMLREVLRIQVTGSKPDAAAFIEQLTHWDDRHDRLAAKMRGAEQYRYARPTYGLLDGTAGGAADAGAPEPVSASSRR
ncbi:MAG TPA: hypothetical protein VKR30_05910 [Candidatus Limnocylindrales bacterium]|nr:hypothetical protein [Candidatus Limnocylindrales bacterium]